MLRPFFVLTELPPFSIAVGWRIEDTLMSVVGWIVRLPGPGLHATVPYICRMQRLTAEGSHLESSRDSRYLPTYTIDVDGFAGRYSAFPRITCGQHY